MSGFSPGTVAADNCKYKLVEHADDVVWRRMGEPQTKGALANQSHAGSGGYQDTTKMEEKAARLAPEADNDSGVQEAVSSHC